MFIDGTAVMVAASLAPFIKNGDKFWLMAIFLILIVLILAGWVSLCCYFVDHEDEFFDD